MQKQGVLSRHFSAVTILLRVVENFNKPSLPIGTNFATVCNFHEMVGILMRFVQSCWFWFLCVI